MLTPCSARSNTDNKMPWILTEENSSRSSESWPLPPGKEVQRCKEQTNRNSTVFSCLFKFKARVLLKCESIHFTNPAALCCYGVLTCAVYQGSHRARRARKSRKGRKGGGNHRRKRVKLRFASSCYCSFGNFKVKPRHSSRSPKHTKSILFDRNKAIQRCKKEIQLSEVPVGIGEASTAKLRSCQI